MAIGFRGSAAASSPSNTSAAVSLTLPTGILGGECILLQVTWNNGGTGVTCSTPSGFTLLDSATPSGTANSTAWYYKIAAGTVGSASSDAGATVSATLSAAKAWGIIADVYSGTDTTSPIHVYAKKAETVAGTSHTAPTVSVTASNCWLLEMIGERAGSTSYTTPAGLTQRANTTNATAVSGNVTLSSAGSNGTVATGTRGGDTWTSGSSVSTAAVTLLTVALAPAVTGLLANAGADQTVEPWATVTLSASASTGATSYAWTIQSSTSAVTPTLTGASSSTCTFTAPGDWAVGSVITFLLTISNGSATSTDTVQVTIRPATVGIINSSGGVTAVRVSVI